MTALKEFDLPIEGTTMHCWVGGHGFPIIFMHGSGTGAQTMSNFRKVLQPLAHDYRILATDLIGYGQSGFKNALPYFDPDLWMKQIEALMERAGDRKLGLVGHSLSGALVLKIAARHKQKVAAVITTATFGASYPIDPALRGWPLAATIGELRQSVLNTVADPTWIDDEEIERRWKTLSRPGYREYFSKMYPENRKYYLDLTALSDEELASITCPVLLMHGADDKSFGPEKTSLPLHRKIRNADVFVLRNCGHSIALEQADKFIAAARLYFREPSVFS